jgi:hypothetical protein
MMEYTGTLRKMKTELDTEVQYWFNIDKEPVVHMNALIGARVVLKWTGLIHCINCGRSIKKTYGQGFCYQCYNDAPEAAPCIMRPELCEAHLGKGRDPNWERTNHDQPHIVYLAQTSGIKVGVTRKTQVPTRWIDQGAWRTVSIAEVPYRQLAGIMEVELKQYISDRTDWRKMLIDERDADDIAAVRDTLVSFLPRSMSDKALKAEVVQEFRYPVPVYPKKVVPIKLEDELSIEDTLTGIRGQYLYFGNGRVVNIRKYSGFQVTLFEH